MKNKRFLAFANLLMGSLIMLLAGCHTQKSAAKAAEKEQLDNNQPQVEQPVEGGRIVCKYGVPPTRHRK